MYPKRGCFLNIVSRSKNGSYHGLMSLCLCKHWQCCNFPLAVSTFVRRWTDLMYRQSKHIFWRKSLDISDKSTVYNTIIQCDEFWYFMKSRELAESKYVPTLSIYWQRYHKERKMLSSSETYQNYLVLKKNNGNILEHTKKKFELLLKASLNIAVVISSRNWIPKWVIVHLL